MSDIINHDNDLVIKYQSLHPKGLNGIKSYQVISSKKLNVFKSTIWNKTTIIIALLKI